MTGRLSRAAGLLLLAAPFGVAAAAPRGASASRLAVAVGVIVRWGDDAGSEAFRGDLERRLASELVEKCFTRVVPGGDDSAMDGVDLLLTVTLRKNVDETLFDDSIVKALSPGEPGEELRRAAHFAVDVDATLLVRDARTEVTSHRLHSDTLRRPVTLGEDPQAVARSEAIERIVGDLRKSLCGSAKTDRRIGDALAGAGRGAPAR